VRDNAVRLADVHRSVLASGRLERHRTAGRNQSANPVPPACFAIIARFRRCARDRQVQPPSRWIVSRVHRYPDVGPKRIVVQGIGNVGYHAAKFCREAGARVIGIAVPEGAILKTERGRSGRVVLRNLSLAISGTLCA
jgi:phosphoglycerate dehydrogenase-like enzyme